MIGKIIGAVIGSKAARSEPGGLDGTGGALLGAGAVAVARRFGLPGLIVAGAGAYALKRYNERGKSKPKRRTKAQTQTA